MGEHTAYQPPKTDGTFGLNTNWSRLSQSAVKSAKSSAGAGSSSAQPLTAEEISTKTLKQLFYWREWRSSSPFAAYSPRNLFASYRAKYLSSKVPSGRVLVHLIFATGLVGFVAHYGKNQSHLFAKHH